MFKLPFIFRKLKDRDQCQSRCAILCALKNCVTSRHHLVCLVARGVSLLTDSHTLPDHMSVRIARILKLLEQVHGQLLAHAANNVGLDSFRSRFQTSDFLHICFEVSKLFTLLFPRCFTLAKVLSKDMQNIFKTLMEYFRSSEVERKCLSGLSRTKDKIWFTNEATILRYVTFAHRVLRLRFPYTEIRGGTAVKGRAKQLDDFLKVYNETLRPVHNHVLQQISEQMIRFATPQCEYRDNVDVATITVRDVYTRLERLCFLLDKKENMYSL